MPSLGPVGGQIYKTFFDKWPKIWLRGHLTSKWLFFILGEMNIGNSRGPKIKLSRALSKFFDVFSFVLKPPKRFPKYLEFAN